MRAARKLRVFAIILPGEIINQRCHCNIIMYQTLTLAAANNAAPGNTATMIDAVLLYRRVEVPPNEFRV